MAKLRNSRRRSNQKHLRQRELPSFAPRQRWAPVNRPQPPTEEALPQVEYSATVGCTLNQEVKARLLTSMHAGRLVVVCGAGLSMAPPSNLPSAKQVAQVCFDEYQSTADPQCDPSLRDHLEGLAEFFATRNMLHTVFIESLVPWSAFVRPSNPGHAAIADFLITRAAAAGLSSNYDALIERRAWDYGAAFKASLDGDEATVVNRTQSPLLKLHGCAVRDPQSTVWAPAQLQDPTVAARIEKATVWMRAHLREKDLLVIGFWTDWDYLNHVIGSAMRDVHPISVTVVDLASADQLQQKAPHLWTLAQAPQVTFTHVQESGADILDELRRAFSMSYLQRVLKMGQATFEEVTGTTCNPAWLQMATFDSETLYGWRRDAEGVPSGTPATRNQPAIGEALGYFHLLLRRAGAEQLAEGYRLHDRTIRVINGASRVLSSLRAQFVEAPSIVVSDIVVAVGAMDLAVPPNVVRAGRVGDVIRPAASGKWLDMQKACAELGV